MFRMVFIFLFGSLFVSSLNANEGIDYQWKKGQNLAYRMEQTTRVTDVSKNNTVETSSKLDVTRHWQVVDVDVAGVATIHLTLKALKLETTTPSGEVLRFDSKDPERSTPGLKDKMSSYVGSRLAILRMDKKGRVLEVKETGFGSPSQFENELPFVGVLPEMPIKENLTWDREYKITLAPPQGTGETYSAVEHHQVVRNQEDTVTIRVNTELKNQPEAVGDRIPLLQLVPEGEFIFDRKASVLKRAELKVDQTLPNHNGPGSSHRFQSVLKMALVEE